MPPPSSWPAVDRGETASRPGAKERLELLAGKLARAVLRGRRRGNAPRLPGADGKDPRKQDLAGGLPDLENLLLRHQLAVLTRPTRTRPRAQIRTWDKLLWVLARRFCAGWREHLTLVTPETVVRWHRQGWRVVWRWKSQSRGGRPRLSAEAQELI